MPPLHRGRQRALAWPPVMRGLHFRVRVAPRSRPHHRQVPQHPGGTQGRRPLPRESPSSPSGKQPASLPRQRPPPPRRAAMRVCAGRKRLPRSAIGEAGPTHRRGDRSRVGRRQTPRQRHLCEFRAEDRGGRRRLGLRSAWGLRRRSLWSARSLCAASPPVEPRCPASQLRPPLCILGFTLRKQASLCRHCAPRWREAGGVQVCHLDQPNLGRSLDVKPRSPQLGPDLVSQQVLPGHVTGQPQHRRLGAIGCGHARRVHVMNPQRRHRLLVHAVGSSAAKQPRCLAPAVGEGPRRPPAG